MSESHSRLLPSLVSVQIALSLVLLIGASLFFRTLQNIQNFDPGFNREGVLLMNFETGTAFRADWLDEVRRLPGVVSASISTNSPLSGATWTEPAVPVGQALPERDNAIFIGAGPRFFETIQTPLLSGRVFTELDTAGSPTVAVVSETFARRHFPDRDPIGQHVSTTARVGTIARGPRDVEIVGIVKNTYEAGLRRDPYPIVYVPYAQLAGEFPLTLAVRATGSLESVAAGMRTVLQPKFPSTPLEVRPLSAQVEAAMVQERMMSTLAGGFAMLALLLACVGLYGLLAYAVTRRTRELGIRMALGAQRTRLIAMVLKGAVRLIVIGIAIGLPAGLMASRLLESMLFGLKPNDPGVIGVAIFLLTIAALIAAYLPARRASKVDPITALRHE
jgi:putative ABC transport system permease protein